jgi:prephenate dehydrogenase
MTHLAVIGPGLLGGSIALAARRAAAFRVSVWARRPEAVEELQLGSYADHVSTDLRSVVANADFVVLCVPIGAMPALARELAPWISPGALVTDVGSVKAPVVAELSAIFQARGRFVGSHPMAGSEQSGLKAARADLFDDAACIVTPEADSAAADVAAIVRFWETLGCRVHQLSPQVHDETVALVSHFPHLLSAVLVDSVEARDPAAFDFVGPGFRDMTRVAGGPPEMWTEILRENRAAVKKSAEAMIEKLGEALKLLDHLSPGDDTRMNQFLSQAKARRDRLGYPTKP